VTSGLRRFWDIIRGVYFICLFIVWIIPLGPSFFFSKMSAPRAVTLPPR